MKEPHRKGVANHPDPESCAGHGNMTGEALTRAHAGQPLSSEITFIGVPTLCCEGEGHANLTRAGLSAGKTRHGIAGRTRSREAG